MNVADAGVVDGATMKMMLTPRCGVADMKSRSSVIVRRRKRFATNGANSLTVT